MTSPLQWTVRGDLYVGLGLGLANFAMMMHLASSLVTMVAIKLTSSPSPITTETVALSGVSFADLQTHGDLLYFACRDPKNAGRACVKSISSKGSVTLHTALTSNVRSAVHEYGGGAFTVGSDGSVIYTDFPSHTLYSTKSSDDEQTVIYQDKNHRFADFSVTNTSPSLLLAVMEDHTDPAPSKVKNSIVTISLDGKGTLETLASGHDFYSSPQLQGDKLAYVAWDHPNMPWDNTMLYIQTLDANRKPLGGPTLIHGGQASVAVPRWTPDGSLVFLSDLDGWYNLYEYKEGSSIVALCPKEADFCSGGQGWILGLSPFTVMPSGDIVSAYTDTQEGGSQLVLITRKDSSITVQEFGRSSIPPTSISSFCSTTSNGLYFVGGSTKEPLAIWYWDKVGEGKARIMLSSMDTFVDLAPLQAVMSEPRLVQFPSEGDSFAFGYFYPPTNLSPGLGSEFKPPLLVKAHGGPTSQTSAVFRLEIQFWTSRGFAVLDVDYGGSTGHGKEFRQSLQGNWGITDIADVCNGALWCVKEGLVNGDWLCIDGRSAGGYTTMAALTFKDVFSAGASLYGVSDLVTLAKGEFCACASCNTPATVAFSPSKLSDRAQDTHKFESRYLDGLVGPYPEFEKVYKERCPINYTEKLSCPMILLQGDEDKIVPPDQAETMFGVLKEKGLPTALIMYKGEQHGFRKGENIRHAIYSEYDFFCQVFGFVAQPEQFLEPVKMGERVDV